MENNEARPALDARWPIAVMVLAVLAVVVLAGWVFQSRPLPLLALTAPELAGLEQQLEKNRDACVAGPPHGVACVEAERLSRAVAQRRRERT